MNNSKIKKFIRINVLYLLIILISFQMVHAKTNNPGLVFHPTNTLSADLENKTLKEVLEQFEKEKGIWIKGNEALFKEKISIHFKDLTIEDSLKRVLSHFNYSIIYTKKGDPLGVHIFGKGSDNNADNNVATISGQKTPPVFQDDIYNQDSEKSIIPETHLKKEKVEVIVNDGPPGGLDQAEAEAIKKEFFHIQKNVPPPGDKRKTLTSEKKELFHIQKNVPPPGDMGP